MKTAQILTRVQRYSLAPGEVGKAIGDPEIAPHEDGTAALLSLEKDMDAPRASGEGAHFSVQFPDGAQVPFDTAYARIFGELPIYRDNKATQYPRLHRKSKKA